MRLVQHNYTLETLGKMIAFEDYGRKKQTLEYKEIFGQRLRAAAEAKLGKHARKRLLEMNAEFGVSESSVAKWWSGKNIPEAAALDKLCAALDCDRDYLSGRRIEKSKEEEITAEYVGLSIAAVDTLRSLSDDEKAALDKILTQNTEKLLQWITALCRAMSEQNEAALIAAEIEKDTAAAQTGDVAAMDRLNESVNEFRLMEHTQPLMIHKAGQTFEALLETVAPPVSLPTAVRSDPELYAASSCRPARFDFLD